MEELNDKDFDQIFKNKIKEGYLEYEEESWLKMEKKLRSRNRFVFLRNASIILLFLSFGIGMYVFNGKKSQPTENLLVKKSEKIKQPEIVQKAILKTNKGNLLENKLKSEFSTLAHKNLVKLRQRNSSFTLNPEITTTTTPFIANQTKAIDNSSIGVQSSAVDSSIAITRNQGDLQQSDPIQQEKNIGAPKEPSVDKGKARRSISLSILVGPDFNSTENTVGGKSGMAVGIGVSVPLGKKLSVQTGLNYGSKKYEAQGYDYTFNNPNTVNIIAGIDASCKVLEIPLRASYTLLENQKSSIDVNAGFSSYIMLKENYRFIYTAASGRKDRFLEEKNANQHYLSVIDLSATYNIKLKNKKFALGVQPYIKIPLAGIGAGSVPLKSSGISLKLNYELIKKK